uniref:Uncharacterized protein n=1 Tax=Sina virus TaxID=2703872 RepID=A0A6G9L6X3_9VIRU|nr:MAG: hypothetical protein [Sina virus]
MEKSAVPVETGVPNPFFSRALEYIHNQEEARNIVAEIQACARTARKNNPGKSSVDFAQLKNMCADNGLKERLRALFNRTHKAPTTVTTLGPPPPANQVYGRFGRGLEVVDVGSGNRNKLKKFTGDLKIICVDPVLEETKHVFSASYTMPFSLFLTLHPQKDLLTSSFMSLCQMPFEEQEAVLSYDGIHLIPDHKVLLSNHSAVPVEGGKYKVYAPGKNWVDFAVPDGGMEVETGYRLLPSFRERKINIHLGNFSPSSYRFYSDARPVSVMDLNYGDMGWKFNGNMVELEIRYDPDRGGQAEAYMSLRNGDTATGTVDTPLQLGMCLEDCKDFYVLLRIESYRGVVFPHCGYTLRHFCDRVELRINGKLVYGPPVWRPGHPCVLTSRHGPMRTHDNPDGVITRNDEKDYYCKPKWTVDLDGHGYSAFVKKASNEGFECSGESMGPSLWEYELRKKGCILEIVPLRERKDKDQATKLDTAMFLLETLDLGEYSALMGTEVFMR